MFIAYLRSAVKVFTDGLVNTLALPELSGITVHCSAHGEGS